MEINSPAPIPPMVIISGYKLNKLKQKLNVKKYTAPPIPKRIL